MKSTLKWEKGIFSEMYEIFTEEAPVGKLKNKSFSETTTGKLNGAKLKFQTKGFLKQHTLILDEANNMEIGSISYNTWMTKGIINYKDKSATWQFNNILNTKWSISNEKGDQIEFSFSSSKGNIEIGFEDNILVLTGLFNHNYYWQLTSISFIAIFASMIPIWTTIIN